MRSLCKVSRQWMQGTIGEVDEKSLVAAAGEVQLTDFPVELTVLRGSRWPAAALAACR